MTAVKSGTMVTVSVSLSLMLAASRNTSVTVAEVSTDPKGKREKGKREGGGRERECVQFKKNNLLNVLKITFTEP